MNSSYCSREPRSTFEIADRHEVVCAHDPLQRREAGSLSLIHCRQANALALDDHLSEVLDPLAHAVGRIRLKDGPRLDLHLALVPNALTLGKAALGLLDELLGDHGFSSYFRIYFRCVDGENSIPSWMSAGSLSYRALCDL